MRVYHNFSTLSRLKKLFLKQVIFTSSENKFLDKITLIITIICIVVICIAGIIFLKIENKDKSVILKADNSILIEESLEKTFSDNSLSKNEYDADMYGLININTATKEELMLLENIGEKTAEAIIEYRKSKPFKNPSDLVNVYGIGKNTYNKIKDKICVK